MGGTKGRINYGGLLLTLIVIFVGFLAFQYLKTNFTNREIKQRVYDTVGAYRSSGDMTVIKNEITALLERMGVTPIQVIVSHERAFIVFHYTYEIETNYLVSKSKQQVEVVDQMDAY